MKRNSFLLGIGLGALAPLAAHLLSRLTPMVAATGMKPLSLYVVAALLNLLLVRYFYRNGCEQSARGVILITFASAMLLFFITKLSLT